MRLLLTMTLCLVSFGASAYSPEFYGDTMEKQHDRMFEDYKDSQRQKMFDDLDEMTKKQLSWMNK